MSGNSSKVAAIVVEEFDSYAERVAICSLAGCVRVKDETGMEELDQAKAGRVFTKWITRDTILRNIRLG